MKDSRPFGKIFYKGQEMEFTPNNVEVAESYDNPLEIEISGELISSQISQEKPMDNTKEKIIALDDGDRLLYTLGYVDEDADLTCKGASAFIDFLYHSTANSGWVDYIKQSVKPKEDDGE